MSISTHSHLGGASRSRYSDVVLMLGVLAILAMMVLPLPPWVIDTLVAFNIAIGLVLLVVALYINSPLEFSVFPSVLLISTLFRLALSISTTRLILLHGHAGHIITAFGNMVAGGNLVVGLVVFLIITVVQFIVVAKGAERVAEVAARFSLDAMPGKQLSIDSDLRSGLIDKDEARRKRRQLEQESKLHGSLDGAMKFVKGDTIAGIVIIAINLLGGLGIGVMQQGLDVSTAVMKYSILTIGEGMVAQVPALLSAMAAGLIVTRSGGDDGDRHLGDAISRQLSAKPRVLMMVGGACLLLAVVPGFPWFVFVVLSVFFVASGALLLPKLKARWRRFSRPMRETVLRRPDHAPEQLSTMTPTPRAVLPLVLEMPATALLGDQAAQLITALERILDRFNLTMGLPLPRIHLHSVADTASWRLMAFEVPIASASLSADQSIDALANAVLQALRRHTALFFGTQETSALLARVSIDTPDIVKETLRLLPLQRIADILRRLLEEDVAIRHTREMFDALADAAQREKDVYALSELVRIALRRQISHRFAPTGQLRALALTAEMEDLIRRAVQVVNGVQQLALDPTVALDVIKRLTQAIHHTKPEAVVASIDIRRHVRKLIENDCFDTPVLSFHELMPTVRLEVVDRVDAPQPIRLEST